MTNQILNDQQLTFDQNSILIGSLLGDGHLEFSERSKYPRFKIDRAIKDLEYLKYQFNYFKSFCKSGIKIYERYDKRYDTTKTYCSFRTRSVPEFLEIYNKWYVNKVRVVPKELELDTLILATWFSDDGNVILKPGTESTLTLKLSTENFSFDDVNFLKDLLYKRYNKEFSFYKKGNGFIIKVSTESAQPFLKEIESIIKINGMQRKYNIWKDCDLNVLPKIGRPKI